MLGIDAFRQQLDEKLDLTLWATEELRKIRGIEIAAEPQLSIVAFRLSSDALTRELVAQVNARKRVMITGAVVNGQFVARICVVSFRTHMPRMQMCMDDIRAAVEALLG